MISDISEKSSGAVLTTSRVVCMRTCFFSRKKKKSSYKPTKAPPYTLRSAQHVCPSAKPRTRVNASHTSWTGGRGYLTRGKWIGGWRMVGGRDTNEKSPFKGKKSTKNWGHFTPFICSGINFVIKLWEGKHENKVLRRKPRYGYSVWYTKWLVVFCTLSPKDSNPHLVL